MFRVLIIFLCTRRIPLYSPLDNKMLIINWLLKNNIIFSYIIIFFNLANFGTIICFHMFFFIKILDFLLKISVKLFDNYKIYTFIEKYNYVFIYYSFYVIRDIIINYEITNDFFK